MGCNISSPPDSADDGCHLSRCPTPYREIPVRRLYQLKEVTEGSPIEEDEPAASNGSDNSLPLLNHLRENASASKAPLHCNKSPSSVSLKSISSGDNLKKSPGSCSKDSALSCPKSSSSRSPGISNDKTQSLKSSHSSKSLNQSANSKDSTTSISSGGFKDKIHVLYVNSDSVEDDNKDCCESTSLGSSTGTYTIAKEEGCTSPINSIKSLGENDLIVQSSVEDKYKIHSGTPQDINSSEESKGDGIASSDKDEMNNPELITRPEDEEILENENEMVVPVDSDKREDHSVSQEESQQTNASENSEVQNTTAEDDATCRSSETIGVQSMKLTEEEVHEEVTESATTEVNETNVETKQDETVNDDRDTSSHVDEDAMKSHRFSGYNNNRNIGSATVSISDLLSDTDSVEDLPCSLAASSSGLILPRPITSKRKKKLISAGSSSSIFSNNSYHIKESTEENLLSENISDQDTSKHNSLTTKALDGVGNFSNTMTLNITESTSPSANWFDNDTKEEAESNANINNGSDIPEVMDGEAHTLQINNEIPVLENNLETSLEIKSLNDFEHVVHTETADANRVCETENLSENVEEMVKESELDLNQMSDNGTNNDDVKDSNNDILISHDPSEDFSDKVKSENNFIPDEDSTINKSLTESFSNTLKSDTDFKVDKISLKIEDDSQLSESLVVELSSRDDKNIIRASVSQDDNSNNSFTNDDMQSYHVFSSSDGHVLSNEDSDSPSGIGMNIQSKVNNLDMINQEIACHETSRAVSEENENVNLEENKDFSETDCKNNIYSEKLIPSNVFTTDCFILHKEEAEHAEKTSLVLVNEEAETVDEIVPRETRYSEKLIFSENGDSLPVVEVDGISKTEACSNSTFSDVVSSKEDKELQGKENDNAIAESNFVSLIERENIDVDEIVQKETHFSETLLPHESQNLVSMVEVNGFSSSSEVCSNSHIPDLDSSEENKIQSRSEVQPDTDSNFVTEKHDINMDEIIPKETHYSETQIISENQVEFPVDDLIESNPTEDSSTSLITEVSISEEEKILQMNNETEPLTEPNDASLIKNENVVTNEVIPRETHYSEKLSYPEIQSSLPTADVNNFPSSEICNISQIREGDNSEEVSCNYLTSHDETPNGNTNILTDKINETCLQENEVSNVSILERTSRNEDIVENIFEDYNSKSELKNSPLPNSQKGTDFESEMSQRDVNSDEENDKELNENKNLERNVDNSDFIQDSILIEDVTENLCQIEQHESQKNDDSSFRIGVLSESQNITMEDASLVSGSYDIDFGDNIKADPRIISANEPVVKSETGSLKIEDVSGLECKESETEIFATQIDDSYTTGSSEEIMSSINDPKNLTENNFFQCIDPSEIFNGKDTTEIKFIKDDSCNVNDFSHENNLSNDTSLSESVTQGNNTSKKINETEGENVDIDPRVNDELKLKNEETAADELIPGERERERENSEERDSESLTEISELSDNLENDFLMKKYEIESLPEEFESPFIIPKDEMRNNFLFEQELEIISEENSLNGIEDGEIVPYNSDDDGISCGYDYVNKGKIIKFNPRIGVKDIESYENERNLDKSNSTKVAQRLSDIPTNSAKRGQKLTEISSLNGYEIQLVSAKGKNSPILGNESPERDCNSANRILIGF